MQLLMGLNVLPGPAPPRHPPPGPLPAPAHHPPVTPPLPDAAVPPASTPTAVLPPPSAAASVSVAAPPAPDKSGAVHAGSKRPRSPESAQEPPAKRIHAASMPDTPSHLGATHLLSHADTEPSLGTISTGYLDDPTCADLSQSTGDVTSWQALAHGSAGSVMQASAHEQTAEI